jgi:hypothetical protein
MGTVMQACVAGCALTFIVPLALGLGMDRIENIVLPSNGLTVLYCRACIRCSEEVYTVLLPSNGRLFWLYCSGLQLKYITSSELVSHYLALFADATDRKEVYVLRKLKCGLNSTDK